MRRSLFLFVLSFYSSFLYSQYVGIGTPTPGSGLEIKGTGLGAQQRITDPVSGNSLVLQAGSGGNLKVTGYSYTNGTAQPLYLGTDGANTFINPNGGAVGIGMTAPTHTLDVNGFIRAKNTAGGNVVSETDGGVNAWAKLWARTPVQSWSIGTSNSFNGNQLYFVNENNGGGIRMAIMPNGNVGIGTTNPLSGLEVRGTGIMAQQRITDNTSGNSLVLQSGAGANMKITGYNYGGSAAVPLYLSTDGANTVLNSGGGNVLQPGAGYGLPKAMVFVLANGTISRCYNAITGATTGGCGFSVSTSSFEGSYLVNLGFSTTSRFFSLVTSGGTANKGCYISSASGNSLHLYTFLNDQGNSLGVVSDFYLIVY